MSRFRRFQTLMLICLVSSSAAFVARTAAQDQSEAAVTAAARALAVEGVKLAQADRCAEAIDKLERAEKLHHAPIVLTRLGECYIKLGRLVKGVEHLRAVLREPLPANPSEALSQAYADAKSLLEATKPKLALLTVTVEGASADTALGLNIDGRRLPVELIGAAHPSDPGEHTIQVSAAGYTTASRRVTLAPGQEQIVTITLVPATDEAADSAAPGDTTGAPTPALQPTAASQRPNYWPAYIAWGTGAAALGVGIGFGAAALANKSDLDASCPNKMCPPEQHGLIDTSKQNAMISTIGCSVAIGAAALGAVLFILEGRADSPEQTAKVGFHSNGADLTINF